MYALFCYLIFFFLAFGPAVIEHILTKHDLVGLKIPKANNQETKNDKSGKAKKQSEETVHTRSFDIKTDAPKILLALEDGYLLLKKATTDEPKVFNFTNAPHNKESIVSPLLNSAKFGSFQRSSIVPVFRGNTSTF